MKKIDEDSIEVKEELLTIASKNIPLASLGVFASISVVSIALLEIANTSLLSLWILSLVLLLIVRNFNSRLYLKDKNPNNLLAHEKRFKIFALITAILLSGGTVLLFPQNEPLYQSVVLMVLAGLSAGSVMSLSVYRNLISLYLAILLLPFVILLVFQNEILYNLIAYLVFIFMLMLTLFARNYNENIVSLIISRLVHQEMQKEIHHQAFYDSLTGLANRVTLTENLKKELLSLNKEENCAAVLFLDLDHFKTINDSLGHQVGDKILQEFAKRSTSIIKNGDTIARLGGDEFMILLCDLDKDEQKAINVAYESAQKLHKLLSVPIEIDHNPLYVTLSIGIKLINKENKDFNDILKHADIAMYRAKQAGRNQTYLFKKEMSDSIQKKLILNTQLNEALKEDEFELYFQPIVDIKTSKIESCEALIRWNHPQDGLIFPDDFIPYSEESNLIIKIGDWVIENICKNYVELKEDIKSVAININSKQFQEDDFIDKLLTTLKRYKVEPSFLKLELTESVAVANLEDTVVKMKLLKEYGFAISMDDFGTGYSSLSYLKNLPFDFLKIDRSFIQYVLINADDASLVKTILAISKQFNFQVIAEGVEEIEQADFLKDLECEYYQGYYMSKPIQLKKFKELVVTNRVNSL